MHEHVFKLKSQSQIEEPNQNLETEKRITQIKEFIFDDGEQDTIEIWLEIEGQIKREEAEKIVIRSYDQFFMRQDTTLYINFKNKPSKSFK